MPHDTFVACRVLMTMPEQHDYIVLRSSDLAWRLDVEAASAEFETEEAAKAEIRRLGGNIPEGLSWLLDFSEDEDMEISGAGQTSAPGGTSRVFASEEEAVDAWKSGKVVLYEPPLE